MSERTEVWESPGTEPGQPAESGELSETRMLPSVDASPVDDAAADTVMVVTRPAESSPVDTVGADTIAVDTIAADTIAADTIAVGSIAVGSASVEEEPKVREPMLTGVSEPGSRAAPSTPLPFTLGVTAALVGEYRWVEHALYALLGRWWGMHLWPR